MRTARIEAGRSRKSKAMQNRWTSENQGLLQQQSNDDRKDQRKNNRYKKGIPFVYHSRILFGRRAVDHAWNGCVWQDSTGGLHLARGESAAHFGSLGDAAGEEAI